MSEQIRATGWMAIIKSYLAQRYFSQYVSGLIAMVFTAKMLFDLINQPGNTDTLGFSGAIIIVMLIVNVWLGREGIRNNNLAHAAKIEAQRRDNPTVIQQMQESLARMENTLPAREDLLALKDAVIKAGNAISLQQDELSLSEDRQKLQQQVTSLDDDIDKLVKDTQKLKLE